MTMMRMNEFKDYLAENVKDYLPQSYDDAKISFQEVIKNGDQHLTGMTITRPGETVVPTIYIDQAYEQYKEGRDIDEIVGSIADIRIEHETSIDAATITSQLMDYDQIKANLQIRVCDTQDNAERLAGLVHTERSDFSATYHVLLQSNEEGQASVSVTPGLMESWGVSQEQLHQDALAADLTREPLFVNMGALMENMMYGTELTNLLEHPDAGTGMDGMPMFCLTNGEKMNAAGLIMQDDMMAQISEIVGGSYYVLPSSLHELLIVPESTDMSVKELSAMVHEVNETQVAPQDKLSDAVQHYDKESGVLENAEKREARLEMEKADKSKGKEKESRGSIHDRLQAKKQEAKAPKPEKAVEKAAKKSQDVSL